MNNKINLMGLEIIKTQGTKKSVGSFMAYNETTDTYLSDKKGNNAFDTHEEAFELAVKFVKRSIKK